MLLPESLATFYVREARMRERIAKVVEVEPQRGETVKDLLPELAHRIPNRVYCSADGIIGRVMFFDDMMERYPLSMYWDILAQTKDKAAMEVVKSENFVGRDMTALEREIAHIRARYALHGDILLKPDQVHTIDMPELVRPGTAFIHTLTLGKYQFLAQYHLTDFGGPTFTRTEIAQGQIQEVETRRTDEIPAGIIEQTAFRKSTF